MARWPRNSATGRSKVAGNPLDRRFPLAVRHWRVPAGADGVGLPTLLDPGAAEKL